MGSPLLFVYCLASIVPATVYTLAGGYLCHKKWLDNTINSQIITATTEIMLPLYVLFSLPRAYNSNELWDLWPLIVSPFIIIPILWLISYLCVLFIKAPKNLRFSIASLYCFSSIGNIGILMVKSSCSVYGPLQKTHDCENALGYLCMMWLPFNILLFVSCCPLFKIDSGYKERKTTDIILKYLLSPLPITAFIANILGVIPGMDWFLFDKESIGFMFSDSALLVGNSGIIFSQMIVGSRIALNWNEKLTMSKWKIAWIVLTRSILTPGVVLLYVYLLWSFGVFYDNKVIAFVIFIGLSTPPSYMIMVLMEDFKMESKDVTFINLWIFITSVVTMTLFSYFFFLLI